KIYKQFYRVLHVPESQISELLKNALAEKECLIRYRAHYPYIDIKFATNEHSLFTTIHETLEHHFAAFHYWQTEHTAIQRLHSLLISKKLTFTLQDEATQGAFKSQLLTPALLPFYDQDPQFEISCSGLETYWAPEE